MNKMEMLNMDDLDFSVPEGEFTVASLQFGNVPQSQAPDIYASHDKFWQNENAYTFSVTMDTRSLVSTVQQIESQWDQRLDASMRFRIGRRKPITTRIIGYTVLKDPDDPDDTSVGCLRLYVELDARLLKQGDIQAGPQIPV